MAISNDGVVYVADRANNRVQSFTIDGTFLKEGFVKRESEGTGTAFGVGLSADPQQRFLYVADGSNERIAILDRKTLEEIGHIGRPWPQGGRVLSPAQPRRRSEREHRDRRVAGLSRAEVRLQGTVELVTYPSLCRPAARRCPTSRETACVRRRTSGLCPLPLSDPSFARNPSTRISMPIGSESFVNPRLYNALGGPPSIIQRSTLTVRFLHVDVDPGVRIDPFHLRDRPPQLDWLLRVEFRRKRVMPRHGHAQRARAQTAAQQYDSFVRMGAPYLDERSSSPRRRGRRSGDSASRSCPRDTRTRRSACRPEASRWE